ncbi:MAG: Protein translocase subunit SecD [candidate division WS6 bacterium OLB20]|uniref:Protein translocase subunit SecD n=1 Tax=candidate division WS6 bacterium OLB20 TaxID=1617426 RepID=A0A136LW19_9BACT|nr:MAG: Protein translocase subunit SecD [candidate division WS6 bacterium OLB20]
MKRSTIRLIFTALVTIVAFLIAIPTITFSTGEGYTRIRGLNPEDLNSSFLTREFGFRPSLDFQEGQETEFTVDLSVVPPRDRESTLTRIRNIFYRRLQISGLGDFELDSLQNHQTESYKLILHTSERLNPLLLELLGSRGQISAWIDDATVDRNEATDEQLQDPFFGRLQTGITNEDIESAAVISDSRIYLFDPSAPQNFGIRLTFRPEAASSYVTAAQQSIGSSPILYAIDSDPIAFQSPGQTFDYLNPGRTSLLATLSEDSRETNAVIASIFSTPTIDFPVNLTEQQTLHPRYGQVTITVLQLGALVAFLLVQGAFWIYFRRQAVFSFAVQLLFAIWGVALLKMFNVTLSLGTLLGFMSGLAMFMIFMAFMLFRLRDFAKEGYSKDELKQVYEESFGSYRMFAIAALFLVLVAQTLGFLSLAQFGNGIGFALVTGILIILIAVRALLPQFYLSRNKKKS